jgi:hypothetical protein
MPSGVYAPILLADQTGSADDEAVALDMTAANAVVAARRGSPIWLRIEVNNRAGTAAVSFAQPGADAHGSREIGTGEVGVLELQWPQPPGGAWADGPALFAASTQTPTVSLSYT